MFVSDPNNVKIYNLSAGKSLPEVCSYDIRSLPEVCSYPCSRRFVKEGDS
jgi:hypothetical protein